MTTQRYDRQIILPEIGSTGQKKLSSARVLCIGAGGLGCPALLYLAGAGIGTIGIVDFDTVSLSNLQRQVLFTTEDQGQSKAQAARSRLADLNPDIEIKAYDTELTSDNILDLFADYDIILDGTDNFPAKFLINDAAVKLGKPVVYGAIQGFDGRVSVFGWRDGPCYRCLHPKPPESTIMNCAEAGVIGAVAGIIGTVKALEAIKIIVGDVTFQPLSGRLWMCDTRSMDTRTLTIPKQADCPVCSKKPDDIKLTYTSPVCQVNDITEISCQDPLIDQAMLVDVREQQEWDKGHIADAVHLPLSELQKNPAQFKPPENGQKTVLYCQKGMRSLKAAEILTNAGFSDLYSLKGGFESWCQARSD